MSRLARRSSPSADSTLLVDARPSSSYQAGHIPTSLLLDFPSSLLNDPTGFTYLRSPEELNKHIAGQLGQDKLDGILSGGVTVVNSKRAISKIEVSISDKKLACGGGISAAINWLSLQSLGVNSRLYDEVSISCLHMSRIVD